MDDPCSELCVVHEFTQNKMAGDAESDIAIRIVDENDYREISAKAVSAKQKFKKSCPSWLVSKHCNDGDSSEEDVQENLESSNSDHDSSADEAKRRKSAGKPKPAPSSSTVTKSSKKALKKSNKRNKSLSEEEME